MSSILKPGAVECLTGDKEEASRDLPCPLPQTFFPSITEVSPHQESSSNLHSQDIHSPTVSSARDPTLS